MEKLIGSMKKNWIPIILEKKFKDALIFNYFDKEYILWKIGINSFGAIQNRCCHKSVKFDVSSVHENKVICPYHQLQFDHHGISTNERNNRIKKCSIKKLFVQVKYQVIWVSEDPLDEDVNLIHFKSTSKLNYVFQDVVKCNFIAVLDNLFDVEHFQHIHNSSFGGVANAYSKYKCEKKSGFTTTSYQLKINTTNDFLNIRSDKKVFSMASNILYNPLRHYFKVCLDNKYTYQSYQILVPIGDHSTLFTQIGFSDKRTDISNKTFLDSEKAIWNEDKYILEKIDNRHYIENLSKPHTHVGHMKLILEQLDIEELKISQS